MGNQLSSIQVIEKFNSFKKENIDYLNQLVSRENFNYRTFGTEIEDHITILVVSTFKKMGFIKSIKDYKVAPDKNYFPDFELKRINPIAIEYKSGNKSQIRKGKWVEVNNSENDMGTLNKWPTKIEKYGGENIFYLFVFYHINDVIKNILDIEIKPFYEFLGLNKDGVLKYREKDGNLRPKDFNEESPISNLEQFNELLDRTNIYRSRRIITKHQQIISNLTDEVKEE